MDDLLIAIQLNGLLEQLEGRQLLPKMIPLVQQWQ
jgi:hypothetical protein